MITGKSVFKDVVPLNALQTEKKISECSQTIIHKYLYLTVKKASKSFSASQNRRMYRNEHFDV